MDPHITLKSLGWFYSKSFHYSDFHTQWVICMIPMSGVSRFMFIKKYKKSLIVMQINYKLAYLAVIISICIYNRIKEILDTFVL